MKSPLRVTMATVAAKAGVSLMTVSRALKDSPKLPEATRQRIQKIAARLGYRPDPAVSQLMVHLRASRLAGVTPIAWVTTHPQRGAWKNNESSMAIHGGAQQRAARLGYRLEEFWLAEPGMTGRRLGDILHHRGIHGLIIAPLHEAGRGLDLPWDRFAAATCGYSLASPNLHRACSHQYHAMQVAWAELTRLGCRRIGFAVPALADERVDGLWRAGFIAQQAKIPHANRVMPLVTSDWSEAVLFKWWQREQPDALISLPVAGVWLTARGVALPRECRLALLNIAEGSGPGVDHHLPELGAAAVDLVVEQLHTHQWGLPAVPKVVMVECSWRGGGKG